MTEITLNEEELKLLIIRYLNRNFSPFHTFLAQIDEKGRLTVPKVIRDMHDIKTFDYLVITFQEKNRVIDKVDLEKLLKEITINSEKMGEED